MILSTKMAKLSICCNNLMVIPSKFPSSSLLNPGLNKGSRDRQRHKTLTAFGAKSGGISLNSILKRCQTCSGKGAIECPGCKGTGKNKKNGNIFERWKCFDCQGFGLKSCPNCGKGGLTPEQRGER